MGEMITKTQLCKKMKISRPTADSLVRQPGFPAVKVGKRKILIPVDKLQEWIERGGLMRRELPTSPERSA